MALTLSVCSASASDFDKVLNTVVSNNMALKYADAENQAAIASLKSENTLDAPEIGFESLWGQKESETNAIFRSLKGLTGRGYILPDVRLYVNLRPLCNIFRSLQ